MSYRTNGPLVFIQYCGGPREDVEKCSLCHIYSFLTYVNVLQNYLCLLFQNSIDDASKGSTNVITHTLLDSTINDQKTTTFYPNSKQILKLLLPGWCYCSESFLCDFGCFQPTNTGKRQIGSCERKGVDYDWVYQKLGWAATENDY